MNDEIKTIKVTVTRVWYPKTDVGFTKGFVIFSTDGIKCKGELPFFPKPGMELTLTGKNSVYMGELQFSFNSFRHSIPVDEIAFLKYAATFAAGIGEKTLDHLVETYGADWRKRLDDMPERFANPLKQSLAMLGANQAKTDTISYFISIGGTPNMGEKAYERWKDKAIAIVSQNVYALTECSGIGFRTVDDNLRGHFGVEDSDIRRAYAAVTYTIGELFDKSGNTIVDRKTLQNEVRQLNITEELCARAIAELTAKGHLVSLEDDTCLTTKEAYTHEQAIIAYLLNTRPEEFGKVNTTTASVTPDASQIDAVTNALNTRGLSIINGGAGSGKTTIIKIIADNLTKSGDDFRLCAFAGKAAARLREATGHQASTIHSMLGYQGEGSGFTVKSLQGDTIIVDEASMLPSSLLYEICKRNPNRLILVGDQAQIPPVGIGQPFHDIIKHAESCVRTVTTCYRNAEAIFQSAIQIRNGERPPESAKSPDEKFCVVRVDTPEKAHKIVVDYVANGLIDFDTDVILSPRNGEKGDGPANATVNALNASIQQICNPHKVNERYLANDRVMFTKNFPTEQAWNGTTGWIHSVDIDGVPTVKIDSALDSEHEYVRCASKELKAALTPCYAMTMHKSQGSQYRRVVIIALRRDLHTLLDRALLYTAVTRSKKACVIVTDCDLKLAVNSVRERKTLIQKVLAK